MAVSIHWGSFNGTSGAPLWRPDPLIYGHRNTPKIFFPVVRALVFASGWICAGSQEGAAHLPERSAALRCLWL